MSKLFYPKLAADSMRKNARTYVPYLITCICVVAMFYIMYALTTHTDTGRTLAAIMSIGLGVVRVFAVVFLFYTNSFLMKRRKKEFGLFNVLGMEKKHIRRIIFFETLFTYVISIVLGLISGMLLFKLVHLLLLNMLQFDIRYAFEVSWGGIVSSVVLFAGIFVLLFLASVWQIQLAKPIELLRGGDVGEREPRANWLLALLGLVCLGAGYWISVTTENPVMVLSLFFLAVTLVIVGTYLLFVSGGVAALKLLRRNKNYYYKPNHFIAVSGMIYRMKQNAAGLATICILSTMVLVMVSSTGALYFGMEDSLRNRYPREIVANLTAATDSDIQTLNGGVEGELREQGLQMENRMAYRTVYFMGRLDDGAITPDSGGTYDASTVDVFLMPTEDYAASGGASGAPAEGEVILLSGEQAFGSGQLSLLGTEYRVKEEVTGFEGFSISGAYNDSMTPAYYIVVRDMDEVARIVRDYTAQTGAAAPGVRYQLGFDVDADSETLQGLRRMVSQYVSDGYVESRSENRAEFLSLYGGLFFLGIFLGLVFLLATVLIIYYKQISEGYDDRGRYAIMRKVGLSGAEAKRSINSQILTMFFLPLAVSFLHLLFAYPAIARMLALLNLRNSMTFVISMLLSMLLFAALYFAVYSATAKTYYKITESEE